MQPKKSFLIALIISVIGLSCWELYWRSQGKYPTLNDDKALWAMHRADVETANSDQVVIFGSSRAYFDIQLSEWKKITGQKPIQLSSTGSPPLPSFRDLVNNTNFSGTVIVGVTPGLFFSTTNPTNQFWRRIQWPI